MESFARRVTDIYISALLLVLPLWTGLYGYADITGSKFRLYAAMTIVWAVLLIFAVLKGRMFRAVRGVFPALAAAFALWAAVSALASPYELTALGRGYDGPAVLCLYALTAAGCCAFGNMRQRYVYLLAVSVTLCCALAFIQLAGLNPLGLYPEGYNYYSGGVWYNGRFLGTMGNTNLLGAFLSLASPLLALNAVGACPRRLCLLLPAAAGCLTIILAGSEAGLLGLLACAAIAIPYYVNRRNRKAAMLALIAEAAALGVFLIFVYFSPPQSGTLREFSELLHGRAEPSFGSHRLEIWAEAARLTAERPVLGGGPGSFALRSGVTFERFVPESGVTLRTLADNAHSEPLAALCDLGAPGLALWLLLRLRALRRGFKSCAPLALALVSYHVQALFGIGSCLVLPVVYCLLGLAAAEPDE